ncbi:MAG TPA: hypothetical protein ENK48_04315 [Gammaproteobacteria bacterium]|nr:hypothetical protein [Gammaproteobacteria bacterium]
MSGAIRMTTERKRVSRRKRIQHIAKVCTPRLNGVVPCQRLLDRLRQCPDHTLTWIHGPAGAGKTILAASFSRGHGRRGLWYHVDAGDEDPGTFFHYMNLALQRVFPRRRLALPAYGPEYGPNLPGFARNYFRSLYALFTDPAVIVLDGLEAIGGEAALHVCLAQAVAELPAGIRLVVTSRDPPPTILGGVTGSGRIQLVDWNDLKLSQEECRALLVSKGLEPLPPALLQSIHELTEGWLAALSLIGDGLVRGTIDPAHLEDPPLERVFDFFAGEIFVPMPPHHQHLLLCTADLPFVTPRMARQLSGDPDAHRILDGLSKRQLLVSQRRDQRQPLYRYHTLFRRFLSNRAAETFTNAERRALQLQTARLLEAEDCPVEAAELYIHIQAWEALRDLIHGKAGALLGEGRSTTLLRWLQALPRDMRDRDPRLAHWEGICLTNSAVPTAALPRLECAYRLQVGARRWHAAAAVLATALEAVIHESRDLTQLDPWLQRLATLEENGGPGLIRDCDGNAACSILLALAFRKPEHARLAAWRERVQDVQHGAESPLLRAYAAHNLQVQSLWSGDIKTAARLVESQQALIREGRRDAAAKAPLRTIFLHIGEAVYGFLDARAEDCRQAVADGLACAENSGITMWNQHLHGFAAASALAQGKPQEAHEHLEQMTEVLSSQRHFDIALYHMLKVWYLLDHHDAQRARPHAEAGLEVAERLGAAIPRFMAHYQMAQVAHEEGLPKEAQAHLQIACNLARRWHNPMLRFMCHLSQAQFGQAAGDPAATWAALRQAMSLGRRHDYLNTWCWRPRIMAELCAEALRQDIETLYVQSLVRRRAIIPQSAPYDIPHWPWPVRIYTMGRFGLTVEDQTPPFGRKTPRKALLLLKLLIALGGRGVSQARVMDILWPQTEGDLSAKSLSVLLVRLRKLLGQPRILESGTGHLTLDPRLCWVDVWAFERALPGEDCPDAEAVARLEYALPLYQGPFLGEDEEPWFLAMRQRLHYRFLAGVERLGELLEKSGRWEEAGRWYLHGIETDPYHARFCQRHVCTLLHRGLRDEAAQAYRNHHQRLATQGIRLTPSFTDLTESVANT